MRKDGTALTRALLHLAMLLGVGAGEPVESVLLGRSAGQRNPRAFLLAHLHENLRTLQQTTGHSPDDCLLLLHMAMERLVGLKIRAGTLFVSKEDVSSCVSLAGGAAVVDVLSRPRPVVRDGSGSSAPTYWRRS